MSKNGDTGRLLMIEVEKIEVLNSRDRNSRIFNEIVGTIKDLGLKKPITVTPRYRDDGSTVYMLICGEGRLKAFQALGQTTIPAMVVDVSDEDGFVMSLAENIARRQRRTLDLLSGIEQLSAQGYDAKDIAKKVGLGTEYIYGILQLLKNGEERLLVAVHKGRVPLDVARKIAGAGGSDKDVQSALQDAYEGGQLRGNQLLQARRVVEKRRALGRSLEKKTTRRDPQMTSSSLVRTYKQEVDRQQIMLKKADYTQQCLVFVSEALRQLMADENFTNLLRAEGLDNLPRYIADRVYLSESTS